MLERNPRFFFDSPFIYFGSNENLDEDFFPFSFQRDLILSNQEKIGLFIHWFDYEETDLDSSFPE